LLGGFGESEQKPSIAGRLEKEALNRRAAKRAFIETLRAARRLRAS
jgi:hypothetical protein